SASPCATAASGSSHRPPSENESGVTLTTPMTRQRSSAGRPPRPGGPGQAGGVPSWPVVPVVPVIGANLWQCPLARAGPPAAPALARPASPAALPLAQDSGPALGSISVETSATPRRASASPGAAAGRA